MKTRKAGLLLRGRSIHRRPHGSMDFFVHRASDFNGPWFESKGFASLRRAIAYGESTGADYQISRPSGSVAALKRNGKLAIFRLRRSAVRSKRGRHVWT